MKFIHLSDLHLGKRIDDFSLIDDQADILVKILNIVKEEKPDGIIIAGDVYDRSIPTEEAIKLWDSFLNSLVCDGNKVYAISGNHDSAVRFSEHNELIHSAGIYLAPAYDGEVKPLCIEDEHGKVNIYMLPFIKPINVRQYFPEEDINSYTDACRVAIEHMNVDQSQRNLLIAHQFVTGAVTCDSENISVGGLDNVDVSVFDCFDYVALGHIHGKQSIGRETVRYCGTPLKYSFSETKHIKSVTVLEMEEKGKITIREIPLKPLHDMREIKGSYEELTLKKNYEGTDVDDYIHVILTDEDDVIDAIGKLRLIYKNIMKLSYDNKRTRENKTITDLQNLNSKSPLELFEELYELQNNQKMSDNQRQLATELIESIWED